MNYIIDDNKPIVNIIKLGMLVKQQTAHASTLTIYRQKLIRLMAARNQYLNTVKQSD